MDNSLNSLKPPGCFIYLYSSFVTCLIVVVVVIGRFNPGYPRIIGSSSESPKQSSVAFGVPVGPVDSALRTWTPGSLPTPAPQGRQVEQSARVLGTTSQPVDRRDEC